MDYNFVYLNATTIMSDFTQNSSVAKGGQGGLSPPIGLKSMQNTLF